MNQDNSNTAKLCKCLNCDIVLIDENPQTNAPELPTPIDAQPMTQLNDDGGFFWVCPMCLTDGNIIDLPQD